MSVYWNRLRYVLSPQFDIYVEASRRVRGKVADVGSGTGFGAHILTRNAKRVDGYEFDTDARDFAQTCFANGHITFFPGDITNPMFLTLLPRKYNWVTMIDVIEHIQDDNAAVANVAGMLELGGAFICSTPNKLSRYRKSENHVREYSQDELKSLLKRCFKRVVICDYRLRISESEYDNPIVAVCSQGVIR